MKYKKWKQIKVLDKNQITCFKVLQDWKYNETSVICLSLYTNFSMDLYGA